MSLVDVVFLLGPLGAPVVAVYAAVVLLVVRRPRWALWTGIALYAVVVGTWLGYWALWGRAFEVADAFEPVPARLDTLKNALMAACALACVVLAATATAVLALARRR